MKIVITSGYFDPVHAGHIELFKLSKALGDKLIVILSRDEQCIWKKGAVFMSEKERKTILKAIRHIDEVIMSVDKDKTSRESIKAIAEKYKGNEIIYTKGGDRHIDEIPETPICKEWGVTIVDSLGKKIQSSSNLTGIKETK